MSRANRSLKFVGSPDTGTGSLCCSPRCREQTRFEYAPPEAPKWWLLARGA